jgi:beta-glucosidase
MKKQTLYAVLLVIFLVFIPSILFSQKKDEKHQMDEFITNLMSKMTLEEKLGQLNLLSPNANTGPFATKKYAEKLKDGSGGNIFSLVGTPSDVKAKLELAENSRLKIPVLSGLDIIHGYKTIFPIPLGLACTWNMDLIQQTARIAAIEASAAGYNWTYSPMVDISRDPRWGRVMEGSGEDPTLGGKIAAAMVKGYQGNDLKNETSLMACLKHFAMYGAAEAGRDYNTTDMSRLAMYQVYLPPYKAAVDAGVGSVMSSFNEVDGVPATANSWLMNDVLRKQWGFKGFVVTDFIAIRELIAHGVAEDIKQAAELAINAGIDMDMVSESYIASLKQSVKEGTVSMATIDASCRRILEAKYKLGLFTNPYRNFDPDKASRVTLTPENKQTAKEAALKSMVLLENKNNTLPLNKNVKIALVGPFADNKTEMFSMWSPNGDEDNVVTLYDGIKKNHPNVSFAMGTQISNDSLLLNYTGWGYDAKEQKRLVDEAVALASKSDVVVAVLGETKGMSGEAHSMTNISLPDCQLALLKALKSTGKPVVLLITSGRPLIIQNALPYADAIIEMWRLGTEAGTAVADVLFGDYNPSGKLTMTFPRSVGQIPIYYNHKNTGRPYAGERKRFFKSNYMDQSNSPLYPFGYGLSYTTFNYSNIQLSDTLLVGSNKMLKAKVIISNTGKYAGEETVQLYLNDPVASVTRPVKELKTFQKVFLQPGDSKELTFLLTPEDLKFYNSQLKWDWESGKFNVYIGTSSEVTKQAGFVWKK